jgi:hypothetical protein
VDPASRIGLSLRTPFQDATPPGACTIEVTIRNESRRKGVWQASIEANSGAAVQVSRHSLSVEAGASRTFLLVGLTNPGAIWSRTVLEIHGPGVSSGPLAVCEARWRLPSGGSAGENSAPYAMSHSLARGIWDAIEQELSSRQLRISGSRFEPADLPADARAYTGLTLIYLRQDEWAALPAGVKEAIRDWVALGGRLWLLGPPASDTRLGFGLVSTWPLSGDPRPQALGIARQVLEAAAGDFNQGRYEAYEPWTLPAELGQPETHRGLLFTFLLVVTLVIGPLNLFWFARGRRRHRVYWTTPLLSAAAALALSVFILVQDGTGGAGVRWTAVAIRPDEHRATVIQEQAARTGLLLGSLFRNPDPLRLVPLPVEPIWARAMGSSSRPEIAGDAYSGWFRSRKLEAHYLETAHPTRGRVEVTVGTPPHALSSIEGVLQDLYVVDQDGAVWHAAGVQAGQRVALSPAKGFDTWFANVLASAGPAGRRRVQPLQNIPGYFYASAPAGAAIETLPSIRWTQKSLLYVGPAGTLQ